MSPKIIFCRHAESVEDVDNQIYEKLTDREIPLTRKGYAEVQKMGEKLALILAGSHCIELYSSTDVRSTTSSEEVLPFLHTVKCPVFFCKEPVIDKQKW